MAIKKANETEIVIKPVEIVSTVIRVRGDTPLIVHSWSEKAKRQMLETQTKATKTKGKEIRNPVADFIGSLYWLTPMPEEMTEEAFSECIANGAKFGVPASSFKQAAISAAYRAGIVKDKMGLRGAFFIEGDSADIVNRFQCVTIHGSNPTMREDMVRVGMGTADLRYRAEFPEWYCDLPIKYNINGQFTLEQIINAINLGGFSCGVCEWRPERDGDFGTYHVESV